MPIRKQDVSVENRLKIQEQVIYNVLFDDIKTITVKLEDISLEDISIENHSIEEIAIGEKDTQDSAIKEQSLSESTTTATSDATSDSSSREKSTLDEEFVKARKEKRAENRARREELAKDLAERNRLLTTKTREQLAGLTDRDQLVFWCIRDATAHGGINGIDIPSAIGQSSAAVSRSMKKLKDHFYSFLTIWKKKE